MHGNRLRGTWKSLEVSRIREEGLSHQQDVCTETPRVGYREKVRLQMPEWTVEGRWTHRGAGMEQGLGCSAIRLCFCFRTMGRTKKHEIIVDITREI